MVSETSILTLKIDYLFKEHENKINFNLNLKFSLYKSLKLRDSSKKKFATCNKNT